MADRRPTTTTLKDIVNRIDRQTMKYTERLIQMTEAMQAHIEADALAFRELGSQILEVNKDVKSLLHSRSFLRGTWFAVVIACTFVAAVAGLILAWYRP
jgi:hypothetical protein